MISRRTQLLHALLAVIGAAMLTLACVWIMAALNRPVAAHADDARPIRCTLIRQRMSPDNNIPERPSEPPQTQAAAEIMTVDLDAAPPSVLPIDPIELSATLPTPQLDAIHVVVRKPVVSPNPSAASQRTTPPGSATNRDVSDSPDESIRNADQVDQPPREPAGNAKPRYPAREQQLGIEGTVVVKLLIDERGRVENLEFISGGQAFRQAVREAARSWRFEPARHEGRAIKVWAPKEVTFTHPRNRR
ncbi:MAG: TonB family protein [Pirellulales bacterium]